MSELIIILFPVLGILAVSWMLGAAPFTVSVRAIRSKWFMYSIPFGLLMLGAAMAIDVFLLGHQVDLHRAIAGLLAPVFLAWAILMMIYSSQSVSK